MQQYPCISLRTPESVTQLLSRATLAVTENQHQPLVLGQRIDGVPEVFARLPGQEVALRRGSEVGRRLGPVTRLGWVVCGLEAVQSDGGLRRDRLGVEAGHRHRASLAGG